MIKYLLDTNICIELIRGSSKKVLGHLRKCSVGQVGIAAITLAELQHGVAKSKDPLRNKLALIEFCAPLEIVPFDDHAAGFYGRIRSELEKIGTSIGPLDTLIAAQAVAVDAVLVTNNLREFKRVPDLKLENWVR